MPTITNFNVDTVASGIAAPMGPLVRVTDMATLPTPNQDHTITFTTALSGVSVQMSYEQLTTTAVRNRILSQAGGVSSRVQEIVVAVAAVYAVTNAMSSPHTYDDLVDAIDAVRTYLLPLKGYY